MPLTSLLDFIHSHCSLTGDQFVAFIEQIGPPPTLDLGDVAIPCFALGKALKKSPAEVAREFEVTIPLHAPVVKIRATGPYLNVFLDRTMMTKSTLKEVLSKGDSFGGSSSGEPKTVVIDYSHPNIAKPFHLGHLRSTNIGASIARILEFTGQRVIRRNYLGDWGTQFGYVLYAWQKWGDMQELEGRSVHYLVELYVRIYREAESNPQIADEARNLFAKLEAGDAELHRLWTLFREKSIEGFNETYNRLGIVFDSFDGEASVSPGVPQLIERFVASGLAEESEGALIVQISDIVGREIAPLMLRKSDGTTTYAARDCAEALRRWDSYQFDSNIYVVSHQEDHFRQVFASLHRLAMVERWPVDWSDRCVNVSFGFVKGLSTRRGAIIWLSDVLDEARNRALERIQSSSPSLISGEEALETAEKIGQAALLYFDLSPNRIKDIKFDWDSALRLEGDTGPYLLYTYARLSAILRKVGESEGWSESSLHEAMQDCSAIVDDMAWSITCLAGQFPAAVTKAAKLLEPHHIASYLFELCSLINSYYARQKIVVEGDGSGTRARLQIVRMSQQLIRSASRLLGISVVERM